MQLPRYHRLRPAYLRLEGQRCPACEAIQFPPRTSCHACRAPGLEPIGLSGRGSVYSFSEAAQAAEGFAPPHLMALVELEEGPLVAAQLCDVEPDEIRIGLPVEMVTRKIRELEPQGFLVYAYRFRPRLEASGGGPAEEAP